MDSGSDNNTPTPVERIRNRLRAEWKERRAQQKEAISDEFRLGLVEIKSNLDYLQNVTELDVKDLATKIKNSHHATEEDLFRLSNAFLEKPENIVTFIEIPGALATLVKEFTGNNSQSQISACEVICNLSLGNAVVCARIASAAGSYLVTFLDNPEIRLKKTCLWVIINIVATGGKGLQTLLSQQILLKLLTIYNSETPATDGIEEFLNDVAKCLDLIFNSGIQLSTLKDKTAIMEKLFEKKPGTLNSEYHLKYIFNSGILTTEYSLAADQIEFLIEFIFYNANSTEQSPDKIDLMKILYAVRVLANIAALYPKEITCYATKFDEKHNQNITLMVAKLISFYDTSSVPPKEIFWLVRNLANFLELEKDVLDFSVLLQEFQIKIRK